MEVVQDTDLAGPLVFCLVFGGLLLFVSDFLGARESGCKVGRQNAQNLFTRSWKMDLEEAGALNLQNWKNSLVRNPALSLKRFGGDALFVTPL